MVWTILMALAVAAQIMGAGYFAKGIESDARTMGLCGALLLLIAPFLFYAAGAR